MLLTKKTLAEKRNASFIRDLRKHSRCKRCKSKAIEFGWVTSPAKDHQCVGYVAECFDCSNLLLRAFKSEDSSEMITIPTPDHLLGDAFKNG